MAERYCLDCGEPLVEGKAFCGGCGAPVGDSSTAVNAREIAPTHTPETPIPVPEGAAASPTRVGRRQAWIAGALVVVLVAIAAVVYFARGLATPTTEYVLGGVGTVRLPENLDWEQSVTESQVEMRAVVAPSDFLSVSDRVPPAEGALVIWVDSEKASLAGLRDAIESANERMELEEYHHPSGDALIASDEYSGLRFLYLVVVDSDEERYARLELYLPEGMSESEGRRILDSYRFE